MKPNPFARPPKPVKKSIKMDSKTNYKEPIPSKKKGEPYPWLFAENSLEELDKRASFVEYLRWMRSPDKDNKDDTKLEIIQRAVTNANYYEYSKRANQRIRDIVGTEQIDNEDPFFEVSCPWRIRVGGHRGPESILLPAFDALGIPYIPSSTLRGVARNQAIREFFKDDWEKAEQQIAPWFGSLDADQKSDRMGKVIFLDAYPVANNHESKSKDGLAMDMVNNIWKWEQGNKQPNYKPNPNLFLSLQQPTFLIGLKKGINCSDDNFIKVKNWLIAGLQAGVGSQINSGYGQLSLPNASESDQLILKVKFTLKGQLIHGISQYSEKNLATGKLYKREQDSEKLRRNKEGQLIADTQPEAELRPIAFKSMLRYWFRALTLGIWDIDKVKTWEAQLFGSIDANYKKQGWLKLNVLEITDLEEEDKFENTQEGVLIFALSSESPHDKQKEIKKLFKNLLWIMSFLGGVGLGARRPYHERNENPKIRGSSLDILPSDENDQESNFWQLPKTVNRCQIDLNSKLKQFYQALGKLVNNNDHAITVYPIQPLEDENDNVNEHYWVEALDNNCEIWVTFANRTNKPHALQVLHNYYHSLKDRKEYSMTKSLCGGIDIDYPQENIKRDVTPSPIWITNYDMPEQVSYQIITVFAAGYNPRKEYLKRLNKKINKENIMQIFPLDDKDRS